jgi:tyrosinase
MNKGYWWIIDWDYHLDSQEAGGDLLKSPILDPISGFGGNGAQTEIKIPFTVTILNDMIEGLKGLQVPDSIISFLRSMVQGVKIPDSITFGGGCLQDGPFKDMILHIGPMGQMVDAKPRCLSRNLNPMIINMGATKKNYARVLKSKTFQEFGFWIESPDFHADLSHGIQTNSDFHTIGHFSVGGEVSVI